MGMFKHVAILSIFSKHMMWSGDVQLEQSDAGTWKWVWDVWRHSYKMKAGV